MTKQSVAVSIILPVTGQRTSKYLFSFLDSVSGLSYPKGKSEVILRDNGLRKSTKRILKLKYPKIKIVGDGDNIYFAKGINEAAKNSSGFWVFITNSDIRLHPDSLRELVKAGTSDSNIAIVAPRVFSLDKKDSISKLDLPVLKVNYTLATLKNLSAKNLSVLKEITDVCWVSGSGMLVKREVWEELGGFDERFLLYWEDADFGARVKREGYRVVVAPNAQIWHKGSFILGVESSAKIYYLTRSYFLFLDRHLNLIGKVFVHIKFFTVSLVKLGKILFGIDSDKNYAFLLGMRDFYLRRFSRTYERYERDK